jgi:hypothetical protein
MEERSPSEGRAGATPGDDEVREKGPWAATARDGIVPKELGGPDAPRETLSEDPEQRDIEIDRSAGDRADALTDGGPDVPDDVEPDLRDAASGPRKVDIDAAS